MLKNPSVIIYQIGRWIYVNKIRIVGAIFNYINRILFSVWHLSSVIVGKDFKLGYFGLGIVIHHDCINRR